MKTKYTSLNTSLNSANGTALLLVMIMCAISLLIMGAILYRTSTVSKLNDRNNKFTVCNQAAEAAAEKVFARMAWDFKNYNLGQVTNNLGVYRTNIPSATDNSYWGDFIFSDTQGNTNRIYVDYLSNYAGALPSQYTNVSTVTAPIYRIVANAWLAKEPDIIGTAQQDVLLSLLPITTFAIFYNGPLEFSWTASMTVRGRTHANDIVCVGTSSSLQFNGIVSSTKTVQGPTRDCKTPSPSWSQGTTFGAGYVTNVPTITVAITMTNSHSIIDMPTNGEDVTSSQGRVRLYNQAHVILIITNVIPAIGTNPPTPQVTLLLHRSINDQLPGLDTTFTPVTFTITNSIFTNTLDFYTNAAYGPGSWLSLTKVFSDEREYQRTMYVTEIDVGAYSTWLSTNASILAKFSTAPATILYVADRRNVNSSKLSVVRLVNGAQLPNHTGSTRGFSVATPNPLYVRGDYNITADGIHYSYYPDSTTNAGSCVPAALLCDAITILSSSFSDSTSSNWSSTVPTSSDSNRLNAAVITGNVPSTGTDEHTFSGGVHNLMRMLEDWTGNYLILNTSIVVLWSSQMATNQFRNPACSTFCTASVDPYYCPPTRQWGFDPNFYDPAKQPPGVPTALVPIRFNWVQPSPGTH